MKTNINGITITKGFSAAKYALNIMGKDAQRIKGDIAYKQWFYSLVSIWQIMYNSGFTKKSIDAAKEAKEILNKQYNKTNIVAIDRNED